MRRRLYPIRVVLGKGFNPPSSSYWNDMSKGRNFAEEASDFGFSEFDFYDLV